MNASLVMIGNVTLLIQNLDIAYTRYRNKLDKIEEFIKVFSSQPRAVSAHDNCYCI
jgi:hypothetical protein